MASLLSTAVPARPAAPAADEAQGAEQALATPPEYRSKDGQLFVTMEARATKVRLGTREVEGSTFNGIYGGPVLRLKQGDTLHLRLVNHLAQITNVHFHGLAVSPEGHSDDSMRMIAPGQTWDYVIQIPADHPPGVYWFHTHGHDFAERQLMGGLSGTLIIEGFQQEVPATLPLIERLMVLKEFSPSGKGGLNNVPKPVNGTVKSINGQIGASIAMQPGETQLWRFTDQTANTYFRLRLEGTPMTVIGRDARPILHPETVPEMMIGPAERVDVLVTVPAAGRYRLLSEPTATGPAGDMFPPQMLATVISAPDPSRPPPAPLGTLTVNAPKQQPIPGDHIDAHRLVSFSEDPVTGLFFINHQTFDPKRVDVKVPLGSIEEWEIRNASEELHVFHIHQLAFQVLSVNGKAQPFQGLQDTIDVPIHGSVRIRMAFTDPIIVGRFMFHCHILEHEDKGMMAQIEVYDPKTGPMKDMDMSGGMTTPGKDEHPGAKG
ncbi:multicopper oxidase family protein [Sphingomonas sp. MMS24-J13]|uniref:multicopper oxidase family protein n=1 Tax=Sphingomonas sp. MMS24-J13 TaxID=3238686 RepID=UPI00384F1C31